MEGFFPSALHFLFSGSFAGLQSWKHDSNVTSNDARVVLFFMNIHIMRVKRHFRRVGSHNFPWAFATSRLANLPHIDSSCAVVLLSCAHAQTHKNVFFLEHKWRCLVYVRQKLSLMYGPMRVCLTTKKTGLPKISFFIPLRFVSYYTTYQYR